MRITNKKVTVIMYHYVRDLKNSRYPDIKGLDFSLFKEQINYIRKHYNVIKMEELIYAIDQQATIPDKSVLLTFDDAYADHYSNVFPILEKYNLQGSFYAPVKAITENVLLDVNKIHFILASVNDKQELVKDLKEMIELYQEEYGLQNFDYYYNALANASRMDNKDVIFIKRLLQVELLEELRTKMTDWLFEKYVGVSESAFSRELYMNTDQLEHMRRSGMHVGSHGYNHYWWNHLNEKEMGIELDRSIDFLKKLGVDMNSWSASYPYGSYDEQAVRMLSERGCKLAVTTEVGIAKIKKENRFLVPRLDTNDIPKDSDGETNEWYLNA